MENAESRNRLTLDTVQLHLYKGIKQVIGENIFNKQS